MLTAASLNVWSKRFSCIFTQLTQALIHAQHIANYQIRSDVSTCCGFDSCIRRNSYNVLLKFHSAETKTMSERRVTCPLFKTMFTKLLSIKQRAVFSCCRSSPCLYKGRKKETISLQMQEVHTYLCLSSPPPHVPLPRIHLQNTHNAVTHTHTHINVQTQVESCTFTQVSHSLGFSY